MAKLNYANRKSEGLKLAQIVAKDLRKKAAASLSKSDNSPIELNLDGKTIPDEGIREISAALVEVLTKAHSEDRPNCQLEELHLPNNAVSALGLSHLAPAIRLAGPWLKDLDLSHNKILVRTTEECHAWEQFLDSFGSCGCLRRLDLSGNDLSGTHAFEILTRVYFRHVPYDPTVNKSSQVKLSLPKANGIAQLTTRTEKLTLTSSTGKGDCQDGCGLRFVPYIVLANVSMDDAGCFQLSYMLSRHVEPQHLLESLKPGPVKQQLDEYDHKSGCAGIIYTVQDLSQYGIKLLEDCERQREDLVRAEVKDDEDVSSEQSTPPRDERPPTPPSAFASMLAPRHKHGTPRRRSSIVSGDSHKAAAAAALGRRGSTFDAESVRWKLQRETIEKYGLNSVELWSTAFRLLTVFRSVFLSSKASSAKSGTTKSAARKVSISTPAKPRRKDSVQPLEKQHVNSKQYSRDLSMPGQLPVTIWQRIIVEACDPRGILSDTQISNIIAYAANKATLASEREHVRNPASNQKWMIIEAMGCLAYEMSL